MSWPAVVVTALSVLSVAPTLFAAPPQTCSYQSWSWHVQHKRAERHERIVKPYRALRAEERDVQSGCTVCEEDQRPIELNGLPAFSLCHVFAQQVTQILQQAIEVQIPVNNVIGYRVGRSRGPLDTHGYRTRFSNHSYGIALDINPEHNGLYDRCYAFGPDCVLRRGGPWRPQYDPYSLSRQSRLVQALKSIGLRWGGEIAGKQKDFMHFSPSGY